MTEELTHPKVNAATEASTPTPDWTVTKYEIRIADIRLVELSASIKDRDVLPSQLVPKVWGDLDSNSQSGGSFKAFVNFEFPSDPEAQSPICIKGSFLLRFTHKEGLSGIGARYYARVNAPILAYPYIREVISDYSGRALGKVILIPLLDVPDYVRESAPSALKEMAKDSASEKKSEHPDIAEANHAASQVDVPPNE